MLEPSKAAVKSGGPDSHAVRAFKERRKEVKSGGPDSHAVRAFLLKEGGMVLETKVLSDALAEGDQDEAVEGLRSEQRAGGDSDSTKVPMLATSTRVQNTDKVRHEKMSSMRTLEEAVVICVWRLTQ